MKSILAAGTAALALIVGATTTAGANGQIYGPFPITVKGYGGEAIDSVSYGGQMARHLLHESLKKLAGQGNGKPDPALKAKMMAYFAGEEAGRAILSPTSKGAFVLAQSGIDELSKKKNLAGKTFKGGVAGWPGGRTGPEVVAFWIDKASSANKGVDLENGYNYPQLISKFLMGAVFYNQAVDNYLDEGLSAEKKPNDKPYSKGARYTGKEHVWDEAFGYFGAAAHSLTLSAAENYQVAKLGGKSPEKGLELADHNRDGKVDLGREMVYAHAYYASSYDKGGRSDYLRTITQAFLDGRKEITSANGAALSDAQRARLMHLARVIRTNWEKVIAESVFKYAGSVYKDMVKLQAVKESGGDPAKVLGDYVKHWGELKGFALALQAGGRDLGETAVRLNRLIGYGPVMPDGWQVNFINVKGDIVRGEGPGTAEYMLHMLKVQKLMVEAFGVTARNNDQMAELGDLASRFANTESAEND